VSTEATRVGPFQLLTPDVILSAAKDLCEWRQTQSPEPLVSFTGILRSAQDDRFSGVLMNELGWSLGRVVEPSIAQVSPSRIHRLNQRDLLGTCPSLQLLLSCNGSMYVTRFLDMNEPIDIVLRCEPRSSIHFMLIYTALYVVCDTNVQHPRSTRQDVDVVVSYGEGRSCHPERSEGSLWIAPKARNHAVDATHRDPSLRSG
jgi:hypothetical protein